MVSNVHWRSQKFWLEGGGKFFYLNKIENGYSLNNQNVSPDLDY